MDIEDEICFRVNNFHYVDILTFTVLLRHKTNFHRAPLIPKASFYRYIGI